MRSVVCLSFRMQLQWSEYIQYRWAAVRSSHPGPQPLPQQLLDPEGQRASVQSSHDWPIASASLPSSIGRWRWSTARCPASGHLWGTSVRSYAATTSTNRHKDLSNEQNCWPCPYERWTRAYSGQRGSDDLWWSDDWRGRGVLPSRGVGGGGRASLYTPLPGIFVQNVDFSWEGFGGRGEPGTKFPEV